MQSDEPQREQYTIGWICALPIEVAAAKAMLDVIYKPLPLANPKDSNTYVLGHIGDHNVVIASLPSGSYGTTPATVTATNMILSFPNIRFGLMVGVGGGIPSEENDIRLGDVVVSKPTDKFGGVIQLDFGKVTAERFERTGALDRPPTALLTVLAGLEAEHILGSETIPLYISDAYEKFPSLRTRARRPESDVLFFADYPHPNEKSTNCKACDVSQTIEREDRRTQDPVIHYGLIVSGNQVIKDGRVRNRIGEEYGALCFEMEAAGLMNDFPCLVVRGICDYSDSHKNKAWQPYAALAAAAYAKELLNLVASLQVETTPRALEFLKDINAKVDDVVNQVHEAKTSARHEKVYRWLKPADPDTNYHRALRTRHPGSGSWFLQSDEFRTWRSSKKSSLWLHGFAGCGKTVLSSSIIEALLGKARSNNSTRVIVYFFFDFSDQGKQSLDDMARSLVCQLYDQCTESRHILETLFTEHHEGYKIPPTEILLQTFSNMLLATQDAWIVLDALDECRLPRLDLLEWIRHFLETLPNGLRLLITSRQEPDIDAMLNCNGVIDQIIALQAGIIDRDIHAYVRHTVRNGILFKKWKDRAEVQEEIETHLVEKANGMFRWAYLQLEGLSTCIDRPTLRQALKYLPTTLDQTYTSILKSIPPLHKEKVVRILQLLLHADYPLSPKGIVDAVAVNVEVAPYFDSADRMPEPLQSIMKLCSGLVAIVETQTPNNHHSESQGSHVQLAHFSVRQYLVSEQVESSWRGPLSEIASTVCNAKLCLAYCLGIQTSLPGIFSTVVSDLCDSISLRDEGDKIRMDFPFAEFASLEWPRLASRAEHLDERMFEMLYSLLSDNKALQGQCFLLVHVATQVWITRDRLERESVPLIFAARYGFERSVRSLIERGVDVNKMSDEYRGFTPQSNTALSAATFASHAEVVRTLLNDGPRHDKKNVSLALERAISNPHNPHEGESEVDSEVLKLLLDYGGDVHDRMTVSHDYKISWKFDSLKGALDFPLELACSSGSRQTVYALLDRGASITEKCLSLAAWYDDEYMMEALLARVNLSSLQCITDTHSPLSVACLNGHKSMVKLLLEHGADVREVRTGEHSVATAIMAASAGQFTTALEILQTLIEAGTDLTVTDAAGRGSLHFAASGLAYARAEWVEDPTLHSRNEPKERSDWEWWGYYTTNDPFPDCVVKMDSQPSHLSDIRRGHSGTVELLLKAGVKPNWQDRNGNTPLHYAVYWLLVEVTRTLLDAGADCNVPNSNGILPLHIAAWVNTGSLWFTKELLGAGADANAATSGIRESPLHFATFRGQIEVVRLLLQRDADCNLADGNGVLPLHLASKSGNIDLVNLLLDYGSAPDLQTIVKGMTPLHFAAQYGHACIVTRLIEAGSEINRKDNKGVTPLQLAAYNGHRDVVEVLCDADARVDTKDSRRVTPLEDAAEEGHFETTKLLLRALGRERIHRSPSNSHSERRHSLWSYAVDWVVEETESPSETFRTMYDLKGGNKNFMDERARDEPSDDEELFGTKRCRSASPPTVLSSWTDTVLMEDDKATEKDNWLAVKCKLDHAMRRLGSTALNPILYGPESLIECLDGLNSSHDSGSEDWHTADEGGDESDDWQTPTETS